MVFVLFVMCCVFLCVGCNLCVVAINCVVAWFGFMCVFALAPPTPCLCVVIKCIRVCCVWFIV